ncbi:MAG TPA: TonB C-terminal domain-containing protein, partial [Terriglobales bacterium]|nr:TonB C-terminal domain-containing protein [Terriglobales bacterium]
EFRRGHLDEARKWYEQAVKLDSQSFVANYYFAAIAINGGPLNVATKLQVVNSLRTAIKLNPSFAPAYDQLAVFFAMQRENLEEAHTLALNAVQLDPGNLRYRLNTANILLEMERGPDAITVLQNAMSLAKTPAEVASVQNLMEEARQYQAAREQSEQERQPGHGIQPTVPQGESAPQAPPSSEQNEPSGTNPSRPEPSQPDTAKAGNGCDLKPATASYGPLELLTETKGVDFGPYLQRVVHDVRNNWYNLIPQQARAPLMKKGKVSIEFAILKNGTVSGMKLTSTSGDVALDRGAWGSIATSSPFQPLPSAFSGEYLGVRFTYFYNPTAADLGDQTTARGKKAAFGDKRGNGDNSTLLLPCVTTAIRMVGEVGVAMVPTAPQVASGEKQQFVALLTGETNSWIYWTVSGAGCSGSACGSISQEGLYTAPSVIPNPASVLVTATLATETGETASTTVTIVPPTGSR